MSSVNKNKDDHVDAFRNMSSVVRMKKINDKLDNLEYEANEIGEDCVGQMDDSSSEKSTYGGTKAESNAKAIEPSNNDPELKNNEMDEEEHPEDHFLLQMCPDGPPFLAGVCCFALGFWCLI